MEERFDKQTQERAVLVGLNADCFAEEETATESTLDELEDLLETAGGLLHGQGAAKPPYPRFPQLHRRGKSPGGADAGGSDPGYHGHLRQRAFPR